MATLLAVELHSDRLSLVKAEVAQGQLRLLRSEEIGLDDFNISDHSNGDSEPTDPLSSAAPLSTGAGNEERLSLFIRDSIAEIVGADEIDSTFAVLDPNIVLSESVTLPFRDQRRVDQTAALQLEDLLPFDLDDYVVDSLVLQREASGQYRVLSTIAPKHQVRTLLSALKSAGVEPRIVSTRASALSALRSLYPLELTGTYLLLGFHPNGCSCALSENGELHDLRELLIQDGSVDYRSTIRDIQLLLEREEQKRGVTVERVFAFGIEPPAEKVLSEIFGREVKLLQLSDVVASRSDEMRVENLSAAIGLFSGFESRERLVDFRKGEFAYKANWRQLRAAIEDQAAYFFWALLLFVLWYGASLYSDRRILSRIDRQIAQSIETAAPGLALSPGFEVAALQGKVSELEQQLQGMGTLSTLSPLDLLLTLSQVVVPQIDVQIESLNVTHQRFSFAGSVGENILVGRLAGILEKQSDRFCEVKVDSKNRVQGSNRVRFVADVKLCGGE